MKENAPLLYYAAAVATAAAGMIHLMLGPSNLQFNINQGILFIVGGMAQVFWIMPMIRRWGKLWYSIGIAGTIALMAIFFITRIPGNPITGRGAPAGKPMAIVIEAFQGIFIAVTAAILVYESTKVRAWQKVEKKNVSGSTVKIMSRKQVPILPGIIIALVLIALFVLPMAMPRPIGGRPPGQGGPPGQFGGPLGQQATTPSAQQPNERQ